MTTTTKIPRKLSNVQAMLLQMFENDLPENDLMEVQDVLTKHFAQKARLAADKAIKDKKTSIKNIEKASAEIIKNRTEYLKKIRHESGH